MAQPTALTWDYLAFAATDPLPQHADAVIPVPLVFESKFAGHGAMDRWMINGKSYPETEGPELRAGQRYRLLFINPAPMIILFISIATALNCASCPAARPAES